MKLLLFSNSTNFSENYLEFPRPYIREFLGKEPIKGIFIPYAGVTVAHDDYFLKVKTVFQELGYLLDSVHLEKDPVAAVQKSQLIVVGGGNTFQLLHQIQQNKLIDVIRSKVLGGTPYIGWSAGSNLACPTICTTNDMPVVQPESFKALDLIGIQINPHFTNLTIPNHGGETREARILEYLQLNPHKKVLGLPEGTLLKQVENRTQFLGRQSAFLFTFNSKPVEIIPGSFVNDILA